MTIFPLRSDSVLFDGGADAILVPTIPTILSLRMVARLVKWADRSDSPAELFAFLNMVDRRKALHRRAAECCADHREIVHEGEVPYASFVEQMNVRRLPLPAFVPAIRQPARLRKSGRSFRPCLRRDGRSRALRVGGRSSSTGSSR